MGEVEGNAEDVLLSTEQKSCGSHPPKNVAALEDSISVIVTSFQGAAFLDEALDSVFAQSHTPAEVIVIDDGSSDGSIERLKARSDIRLLLQNRKGVGAARNLGIQSASGNYIAFLDGDDVWHPDKLRLQYEALKLKGEPSIALSHQRFIWAEGMTPPSWVKPELLHVPHATFVPSALLAHAGCFERIGLFDEKLHFGGDTDFISRARDAGIGIRMLEDVLLLKRLHLGNNSKYVADNLREMRALLRASIRRKQHA